LKDNYLLTGMKKFLLIISVIILSFSLLSAQKPSFKKRQNVINIGMGMGTNLYSGVYYNSVFPPVCASFETGIREHILERGVLGIGAFASYSSYRFRFSNNGWKTNDFIIGARGNFHYPFIEKLDTYTGLMAGYGILSYTFFGDYTAEDYTGRSNGLRWSWFLGARYYYMEDMAFFAEIGYGICYLNAGISFRF
jgi:hypothetical protein